MQKLFLNTSEYKERFLFFQSSLLNVHCKFYRKHIFRECAQLTLMETHFKISQPEEREYISKYI